MIDYPLIFCQFKHGDLRGFYSCIYPGLLCHTMRLLGNELSWLAEDCLQDIVLAAFERRNSFVDSDQWHAWILTSIRNHTVDIIRKSNSSKKYTGLLLNNDDIHDAVEADIIEQETMNTLFEAINSLPQKIP